MSYILQALKRAEEDRRAGAAAAAPGRARPVAAPAGRPRGPDVTSYGADKQGVTPTRPSLWLWLVAIAVGIVVNAVGFGAAFVVSRPSSVAVVAPPPAPKENVEAPTAQAPPVQTPPDPAPPVQTPPVQTPAVPAPTVPAPAAETKPSPTTSPDVVARARAQTSNGLARQGDSKDVDRQPQGEAVAMAARTETTPVIVPPPLVPVRPLPPPQAPPWVPPAPETRPEPLQGKASRLRDRFRWGGETQPEAEHHDDPEQPEGLKEALAGDVTKLRIEVLVWAAEPEKRMIYVSGRKYVEGDAIEKGTVIEQIARDGVVLMHQGQRIRVPR